MKQRLLLMDEPFAAIDTLTRRSLQEEPLRLWRQLGFTLLFVTHSIEEALLIGRLILLLSPHPGRVRAELNAEGFDLAGLGAAFQAQQQRIHRLLFEP
jgi:NitT/TauT family transport system ATP-binding protein